MVEEKKLKQKTRFTDNELSLVKNTFADNEELLKLVRKMMFGAPLTEEEDVMRLKIINEDLVNLLRKFYLPEPDFNAPLGQIADLWKTLKINESPVVDAYPLIEARASLIKFIEDSLNHMIEGVKEIPFNRFDYEEKDDTVVKYIKTIAHQEILLHIEQQTMQIMYLAGTKAETEEEMIKRLNANSNK